MTTASNSEARKRAAGIAATAPTAQEPAPTLGDAPRADSEALAAREADVDTLCALMHDAYEAEAGNAGWDTNPKSRAPWSEVPEANKRCMRAAVRAVLGSSWLADHDRQTAERVWSEVESGEFAERFLAEWVRPYFGDDALDVVACIQRALCAARQEARRG